MSDADVVTFEKGTYFFRASALGSCQRALVAARLGLPSRPPPDYLEEIMEKGKEMEDEVEQWLEEEEGWSITDQQKEIILPIAKNVAIRGHIDGIIDNSRLLEIKTASESVYESLEQMSILQFLESRPKYLWQISVYMHALGMPAVYAVACRDDDRKKMWATIPRPPISRMDIRRRVLEVEVYANDEEYPLNCEPHQNPRFCNFPDVCLTYEQRKERWMEERGLTGVST